MMREEAIALVVKRGLESALVVKRGLESNMCWCSLCVSTMSAKALRELAEKMLSTASALNILASFATEQGGK